jgi:hypothetical protein
VAGSAATQRPAWWSSDGRHLQRLEGQLERTQAAVASLEAVTFHRSGTDPGLR